MNPTNPSSVDATPEQVSMARRIAAETVVNSDSPDRAKRMILAGEADNWHGVRSALAALNAAERGLPAHADVVAIIERTLDTHTDWNVPPSYRVADAILSMLKAPHP